MEAVYSTEPEVLSRRAATLCLDSEPSPLSELQFCTFTGENPPRTSGVLRLQSVASRKVTNGLFLVFSPGFFHRYGVRSQLRRRITTTVVATACLAD
jgi:hypothetical protein